jgi:hypothetical protein
LLALSLSTFFPEGWQLMEQMEKMEKIKEQRWKLQQEKVKRAIDAAQKEMQQEQSNQAVTVALCSASCFGICRCLRCMRVLEMESYIQFMNN